MSSKRYDIVIVGGGIVGLATAWALVRRAPGSRIAVLEAESRVAEHQTGHNSGVIHSGLYYKPGSLKAINCTHGRQALYRFCAEHEIAHDRCGKVVVATSEQELPALQELARRGQANGLEGLERLDASGLRDHEPHVRGIAGLHVPQTGIVDFPAVAQALATAVENSGADVRLGTRLLRATSAGDGLTLESSGGALRSRYLIGCAGLQSDRIARCCGLEPAVRIIPFRGEYYKLKPTSETLVRNLIYPVPDSRFPFLGVHFTRMIGGGVEAGPNAVLALKREGYTRLSVSARDMLTSCGWPGFWRMAARHWRTGLGEVHRSFSKAAFVRSLQRLVPELSAGDVERHGAGVRAQAVGVDGALLDDFHFVEGPGQMHVLNAPSPAATASLSIGESLAQRACAAFDLKTAATSMR